MLRNLGLIGRCTTLALGFALTAFAQTEDNPDRRVAPVRGLMPSQTYQISDIESVNMSNGGLSLRIPLAALPAGPGRASQGVTLHYNSKHWETVTIVDSADSSHHDLQPAPNGGTSLSFGYTLERADVEIYQPSDPCGPSATGLTELRLLRPDGGEHKLYWNVENAPLRMPQGCQAGVYRPGDVIQHSQSNRQIWYTVDGSFLRLEIEAGPSWPNNDWTVYEPNGSRVEYDKESGVVTRYDRNGHSVTWTKGTDGQVPVETLSDGYHSITMRSELCADPDSPGETVPCERIQQTGYGGAPLEWVVYHQDITYWAQVQYKNSRKGIVTYAPLPAPQVLATRIDLPARTRPDGSNFIPIFRLEYAAQFRELSRLTLPTGTTVEYSWALDADPIPNPNPREYYYVLANALTQKKVTYEARPGVQAIDLTGYNFPVGTFGIMSSSSTTAPDGGVTSYEFNPVSYRDGPGVAGGLVQKVTRPDGSQVGTHWSSNAPPNIQSGLGPRSNHYVAWEHETAVGSPNLIRTRRFEVDQNGNRFGEHERSWAAWGGTPPTDWTQYGNLMRSTVTALQTPGPPIGTTTIEQSVYIASTAPRILGLPASITVNNGTAAPADEKREFGYYSPQTGNVQTLRKLDRRPGDTDGVWREWSFEYENSNQGRIAKATDPDGKWTAWTYSGFNLASKSVPDVGMTTYAFDPDLALLTSQQLPNGRTDTFTYDSLGRLLTSNQGGQSLRRYAYDDQARWIVERSDVELPGDQRSASVYYEDGLGRERLRRTLEAKPASDVAAANEGGGGIRVETVYEVNTTRNAVKVSNPYRTGQTEARGWTVTVRDGMGRTCAVENYAGASEPTAGTCGVAGSNHGGRTENSYGTGLYGSSYATTETVLERGIPNRKSIRAYDALGRLFQVTEDPDGAAVATSYSYDSAARLTGVNQAGRTRSFSYSTIGWLVSATNPESGTITYDYTGAGQLLKRTDAQGATFCQGVLSGTTCTPSFNGAGQPLAASYSDGTPGVSYTYEYGRLKTVTNSAAATSYDYDTLDRVTARTETVDGASYTFSATWAPAGLKTETYPSGRVVTHTYNDVGQLLNLSGQTSTEQRNYVTNAAWAAHGASKTLPLGNGVSETWNWNYRLQPTGVTAGTFSLGYKYCSDGSDTCGTNNGNLTQQTIGHANVTQSYTYDAFGRIADARERVSGGPTDAWVRTYGYDTWGNRWVAAGSGPYMDPFTALGDGNFNVKNQLVLGTAQYDPAGNQTRLGDYTFTYDVENRLKTSTINGSTVTHYYDGEGRRVKRVGPGTRTVVYAYGVDGELAAEYDTEPSTVPGGVQYVAVDHLGSTRAVMDGAGAVTRLEDFLPFGETIPAGIAGRGASYPATAWAEVAGTSKRFTGKEREGEVGAGLDYFGARYFSGAQGRFTSPDTPLLDQHPEDPQSWNLYSYVRNNPLIFTDPTGNDCVYLNSSGTEVGSVNNENNSKQCGKTGGYWVDGTVTQARFAHGSLILTGTTNGEDRTSASYALGPDPRLLALQRGAQMAEPGVNLAGQGLMVFGSLVAPVPMAIAQYAAGNGSKADIAMAMLPELGALYKGGTILKLAAASGKKGAEIIQKSGGAAQALQEFAALGGTEVINGGVRVRTLSDGARAVLYTASSTGEATIAIQQGGKTVSKFRY